MIDNDDQDSKKDQNSKYAKSSVSLFALGSAVLLGATGAYLFSNRKKIKNWFDAKNIIPKAMKHIIEGDCGMYNKITNEINPTGGHSIISDRIRVIGKTETFKNTDLAYFAENVEIFCPLTKTYLRKKPGNVYTMFCDDWNENRIEKELVSAYQEKEYFTKNQSFSHKQIEDAINSFAENSEDNAIFRLKDDKIYTKEIIMWRGTTRSDLLVEGYLYPRITAYPKALKNNYKPKWLRTNK